MNTDQQALPLYSYENTPSSSSFAGVRKTIVKKHVDVTCPKTTRTHVLLVRETYSGAANLGLGQRARADHGDPGSCSFDAEPGLATPLCERLGRAVVKMSP